jgi:hypothetical protein
MSEYGLHIRQHPLYGLYGKPEKSIFAYKLCIYLNFRRECLFLCRYIYACDP